MASESAAVSPSIAAPWHVRAIPLLLDFGERAALVGLYGVFTYRLLGAFLQTHNIAGLFALASETFVLALALIRRPAKEISLRPFDWALAFGATWAPLLLRPSNAHALGPADIGLALQAAALAAQLWSKAYLFRNFGVAPALREISVKGPYALVRHPLYASYFVGQLGFLYAYPTLWNAGILAAWTIAQVLRVIVEERLLSSDPAYQRYAQRVRWRLVPGIF